MNNETQSNSDNTVPAPASNTKLTTFVGAACIGLFLFVFYSNLQNPPQAKPGSILVLPFASELEESTEEELRYSSMQNLIAHFATQKPYTLLAFNDVLTILKRGEVKNKYYERADINKVFRISGASLIVEATIERSEGQLVIYYGLHQRNSVDGGSVSGDDMQELIAQLSQVIAEKSGILTSVSASKDRDIALSTSFNKNTAQSIDKVLEGKADEAISLLSQTLTNGNPTLQAISLIIELKLSHQHFEDVDQNIEQALLLTDNLAPSDNQARWRSRLFYWRAQHQFYTGQSDLALSTLEEAKKLAESAQDTLYLAYIAEQAGLIHKTNNHYQNAKNEFLAAIEHYEVLYSPYGTTKVMIHLAEIALDENDNDLAHNYLKQSIETISIRGLVSLQALANPQRDRLLSILKKK